MPGTPTNVRLGPGSLYVGAVGATEPTNTVAAGKFSDAINSTAWVGIGYTDAGHTFTQTPAIDPVEVAEVLIPINHVATGQDYLIEFACAEITALNLQRAFNGGTITTTGTTGTQLTKFEPPAAGAVPTRLAILWQSDDQTERWIYRRCFQQGASGITRQKGANKATIPVAFALEQPTDGVTAPFAAWFAA